MQKNIEKMGIFILKDRSKNSLEALTVLCVECIMIVRMTLCSLDWVSVLCVATCVNKVTYAGCVYKLKCLPIVYVTIFIILTLSGPYHT